MKIISWNCRGLGNGPAVQGLLDMGRLEDPDILFLAKTKLTEGEAREDAKTRLGGVKKWRNVWGHVHVGRGASGGHKLGFQPTDLNLYPFRGEMKITIVETSGERMQEGAPIWRFRRQGSSLAPTHRPCWASPCTRLHLRK